MSLQLPHLPHKCSLVHLPPAPQLKDYTIHNEHAPTSSDGRTSSGGIDLRPKASAKRLNFHISSPSLLKTFQSVFRKSGWMESWTKVLYMLRPEPGTVTLRSTSSLERAVELFMRCKNTRCPVEIYIAMVSMMVYLEATLSVSPKAVSST